MIVSEISSGLGNQMFQFAAGYSLANYKQTDFGLDISWYKQAVLHQTPRQFDLGVFPIQATFVQESWKEEHIYLGGNGIINRLKKRLNRSQPPHRQRVYVEPHFHVDHHFFQARNLILLSGYWQSEWYFLSVADDIRKLFSLTFPNGTNNALVAQEISKCNAISVHVRRGDMVRNPDVAAVHGSCNTDYYLGAIQEIAKTVEHPVFYVFSDEPDWCRNNLHSDFPMHYISGNDGKDAFWDMQLMRLCKHHIIANSSFSWWGAWLNPSAEKIVLAPQRWFNNAEHNTKDLLPKSWRSI